jgi:hypothetical protein
MVPNQWTKVPNPTGVRLRPRCLWEPGDTGRTTTWALTSRNASFSTIHSPYYLLLEDLSN